ncbi:unnamed protein product [Blepharisma stoltei]|uniref:Hexose transporter 1 n=1 Tax=Blepharisma stoltei TaxID=1481888 RepID=A0AAU9IP71_9CILI|nr:unnamed protein product [Blepharisma stoltei]
MDYNRMNHSETYNKKIIWKMGLNASLGSLIFGYNFGVFNTSQENVSAALGWNDNKDLYISIMTALFSAGGLFGATSAGLITNKIGRRRALMLMDILHMVSCALFAIIYTPFFAAGRFLTGYVCGVYSTLVPLYLSEIAPADIMGKIGDLSQLIIAFGVFLSYVVGLPLPIDDNNSSQLKYYWILMFTVQILFSITQFFILYKVYKYDTPVWYLSKHQNEKALYCLLQWYNETGAYDVLKKFGSSVIGILEEDHDNSGFSQSELTVEICEKASLEIRDEIDFSYKDLLLFRKKTGKMMRLGFLMNTFQSTTGVAALTAYTTKIFMSLGMGTFEARIFTVGLGILNFLSTLSVIPIIDKFNRKTLLMTGVSCMCLSMFSLGFIAENDLTSSFLVFTFIITFIFGYGTGIGTICWVYSGEILTSRAMAICIGANWFWATVDTFTFPNVVNIFSIGVAFWIYSVICLITIAYFLVDFVETRGLNKFQIRKAFEKFS